MCYYLYLFLTLFGSSLQATPIQDQSNNYHTNKHSFKKEELSQFYLLTKTKAYDHLKTSHTFKELMVICIFTNYQLKKPKMSI